MDQITDGHPAAVATSAPPTDSRPRQIAVRAKQFLLSAVKVSASAASTLIINVVLLLIVIPIGIAIDQLFWSIAITELTLLVICLIAAAVLTVRTRSVDADRTARRSVGAGLIVGWAVGYVGLISLVVVLIVAVIIVIAIAWALMMLFWFLAAIIGG